MREQLQDALQRGCNKLSLSADQQQIDALIGYIGLLEKWNKVYNLTAVRDPQAMIVRHLLDSLAIAPWCVADRFIDVGTGAGLPGVPLAIMFPQKDIHVLDSNSKKTRFLIQVKTALGLNNLSIHHSRVEAFIPQTRFDVVLSRAFASLFDMVHGCSHLLSPGGQFFAMKGDIDQSEIDSVRAIAHVLEVHQLQVPELLEQRHLIILSGHDNG